MPPREPILIVNSTDKPVDTLVVQIVLWYLDSGCSKHMIGDRSQLVNFVQKFLGTVKFGNDHVAKIMGYGDYQIGNVTISWASKTKSWLWHHHLSHLNFGAIKHLARQGLVRGLPKLKFEKDHLCSACAMGKSTRKTHKPKSEDTNQEKLYLLHMDLCGPMRVESYASQAPSSIHILISYPPNDIQSSINHNVYNASSSIPQMEYAITLHQQTECSPPETGLVVLVFQKGDDPINAVNHMMSFLTAVVTLRYPATNNQLRTSSNPCQQATINNGKVTIQPIQERQTSMTVGSSRPYTSGSSRNLGKQIVIMCYNCKGEGHTSKQCTKPKRKRDADWFKDKVKELNNIVFKINQSAQTVHMLTKPQFFYDHSTRQAIGFENPCYLKRTQQLKPKLYDGSVIEKSNAIVIHESKETLLLVDESRSKMLEKQNNPKMSEKKYSVQYEEPNLSASTTIVEVPKELPKVSMELFNSFDQFLIDELTEVQNVFKQMEHAVEQHCVEKNKFQDKMKNVLKDNDRLLKQALSLDIVNIVVHDHVNSACMNVHVCKHCVTIETELPNDFIKKECHDTLLKKYNTLEKHCISLEVDNQLKKEIFQRNNSFSQDSAPTFAELFEINDLKAQSQEKDTVILKLKERLKSLSDVAPIAPKLRNNNTAHTDYLRHTQEETATLRELVESERLLNPLNTSLDYALNRKFWQPTGKMFTTVRHIWKPTGWTFTLVGNVCPLTRIATTAIVPFREPIPIESNTDKPVVTLVVQIVLWYLDSGCSKHMTGDRSQLINFVHKFLGTVKFRSDHLAKIMGYGDYKIMNASKTKSWIWHRRLSHLNFGEINHLARQGLVRGLSKLKFEKDHLCSTCAMGKSTKKSHKPISEDTNQEKLYLLHMDLCGPMRVKSVNGKKYILVIVNDYYQFTWVKFLRSKDEAPDFIIKFLKMIQVRLKVSVRHIQTDNRTEFVNQTLREYYEEVSISHETLVARSPQQNGVVERRNRTLIEAARTMLIYAQASLFLWAEAVATTCFTQNRSIIRLRHRKTLYELLHNKLPDLSFLHVFGALCCLTNDSEKLGKLQPKADIEIFIGYAPTKKAFRIYNRRTRRIVETIHVNFDELTTMASEQSNWDLLFQPMFDKLLNPSPSVDHQAPEVIASIAEVIPLVYVDSIGSPSSTTVDQDAPSPSKSHTTAETQSSVIPQDVEEDNL
nr:retrovirus-related Pol polyprotein from transposon TNT 1-94 [Tanacetum cinerariifolium]